MRIDILTLFPDMCNAVMNESIIGRAQAAGKVEIVCTNICDLQVISTTRLMTHLMVAVWV